MPGPGQRALEIVGDLLGHRPVGTTGEAAVHIAAVDRRGARAKPFADPYLTAAGRLYPCGCSRRDVEDEPAGLLGPIYPGTCRDGTQAVETALRVRTTDEPLVFERI